MAGCSRLITARTRKKRFENEVRVLRYLEARGCNFVPRLLEADEKNLRIITTNCGTRVEHLDDKRAKELFAELEKFGVRHDDPDLRNVTYRFSDGRFCLIDFEFATILPESKTDMKRQPAAARAKKSAVAEMVRLLGHRQGPPEQRGFFSRPAIRRAGDFPARKIRRGVAGEK